MGSDLQELPLSVQWSVDEEPLLTGQQEFFPTPRSHSLFQYEKTDTTYYITSVQWLSLKWFTIIRAVIWLFFVASTPFLITTFHAHQPSFFLTPRFILHTLCLLFYTIALWQAGVHRTLLKQMHDYSLQLDPVPTPNSLKFAHFLYTICISFIPTYYAFEFATKPQFDAQNSTFSIVYHLALLITILFEVNCNAIPLLHSHWVYIYALGVPYIGLILTLYQTKKFNIQANWFTYLDQIRKVKSGSPNPDSTEMFQTIVDELTTKAVEAETISKYEGWIVTICLLIAAVHTALLIFCLFRCIGGCRQKRHKKQHNQAVYFFNTTAFGGQISLPTGVHFHVQNEAVVNPLR